MTAVQSSGEKGKVHQLLMTRFNLRTAGVGYLEDQSPQWLEERFKLFERYCASSINAQTQDEFDWIIFCDPSTSPEHLQRIRAADPRIRIAFFAKEGEVRELPEGVSTVVSTLRTFPHVRPGTDVVVATRIDNDDAFNRHALKRVRDLVPHFLELGHPQWLYNPQLGYKLDAIEQELYLAEKPNSAFLTMFEKVDAIEKPAGPFSGNHSTMYREYPSFQDTERRFWVMVVHKDNVLNRLNPKDTQVDMAEIQDDFVFRDGREGDQGAVPATAAPTRARVKRPAHDTLVDLGKIHGTDKDGHGYLREYDLLLAPLRTASFDLLEIGVFKGASIRMWHDYFPKARIFGLDLKPDPGLGDLDRYTHVQGSQTDWRLLNRLGKDYNLRLVIDDGSHLWGHQIFTFQTLFPWLAPGSTYVCEDLHTSFGAAAEKYHGGADESAADYFLRLARHHTAGNHLPLKESADPLLYHILKKIRRITFIHRAVIIQT
ncbi:MAG: hypothetical protein QOF01_2661 [Thermomicrobiales bacterium]|nr:hypothetical protein [Thermomicrobiales bacterium]